MGEIIDVAFGPARPETKVLVVMSIIQTGEKIDLIIHESSVGMADLIGLITKAVEGGNAHVE